MQKKIEIQYMQLENIFELSNADSNLIQVAYAACQHSYSPYSKFPVGASIRFYNEEIVTGTNIENASYPCGVCAERTALYSIPSHLKNIKINSIAICCWFQNLHELPSAPCGLCRQVLCEYELRNKQPIRIILGHPKSKVVYFESSMDLMPFAFSEKDLVST